LALDIAPKTRPNVLQLGELCLGHLAEDPEQLERFIAVAGYDPPGLRAALGTEALAHGLIDYFAANESLMLAFCANNAMRPEAFMRVWHTLNPAT
jgi:hypothetical protein